ncbi:MAG TPA: hypothetical protein VF079_01455 [Sphingomicrobium sp.]
MLLSSLLLMAGAASAQPARDMPVVNPLPENALCPETPMSLARKMGRRPPQAIPLSKLPPALTFMAVDRRIDGCPAPLTATEYRRVSRRR